MMRRIIKIGIIAIFFSAIIPNIASASTKETIELKSYMQGLYTCYTLKVGSGKGSNDNGYKIKDSWYQIDDEIEVNNPNGFSYRKFFPNEPAGNKVNLPNGLTQENDDSRTNCSHLANGGHDGFTDTIYDRVGKSWVKFEKDTSSSEVEKIMNGMGYKASSSSSKNSTCLRVSYHWRKILVSDGEGNDVEEYDTGEGGDVITNCIIVWTDSDGDTTGAESNNETHDGYARLSYDGGSIYFNIQSTGKDMRGHEYESGGIQEFHEITIVGNVYEAGTLDGVVAEAQSIFDAETSKETIKNDLYAGSYAKKDKLPDDFNPNYYVIVITSASVLTEPVASEDIVWKMEDHDAGADSAMAFLGNSTIGTTRAGTALTKSERVVLYQYYISEVAKGVVTCESTSPDDSALKVTWFETDSEKKSCYIYPYAKGKSYNMVDDDGYFTKTGTIENVVSDLNAISGELSKLTGVDDIASSGSTSANTPFSEIDDSRMAEPDCYTASGSLGWILCPIINSGGDAVVGIYDKYIVPFLRIDGDILKDDSTLYAWTQFQTISNIIFAVVFLIVIISQLTGFGIDNYGIKKTLPKLIAGAILINLSYILCRLLVDVSNIAGEGIKQIFDNIGKINLDEVSLEGNILQNGVVATGIIVVIIGLITRSVVLSQGWAVLLPILLTVIGVAIAILTAFCILAVRKALAIVLVAVSPLAFVAYMLPNTKNLFNKWLSAFKAMLVTYPVCSAMIFGGQAVARIMLATANEGKNMPLALAISAAVMSVAPIFLIPSTVKKSMGAISGVANAIQGWGTRKAQNKVRDSRWGRYSALRADERRKTQQGEYNSRRASKMVAKMDERMRKGKTLADFKGTKQREYMASTGMIARQNQELQSAYALSFDKMSPEDVAKSFTKMATNTNGKFDANLASAAIKKLADSNQHDKLNEMLLSINTRQEGFSDAAMTIGNQLSGLKGANVIAGLYGKSLASGSCRTVVGGIAGLEDYMKGTRLADGAKSFKSDISNAGKNIIASQDDSTLRTINTLTGGGVPFTDEQMRNSIGNLDTKQQNAMNAVWGQMSIGDKQRVLSGLTTEQYAQIDKDFAATIGNGNYEEGRRIINASVPIEKRQALLSDENAAIRAKQSDSQSDISSWSKAGRSEKAQAAGAYWDSLDNATQKQITRDAAKINPPANGNPTAEWLEQVKIDHFASDADRLKGAGYRA